MRCSAIVATALLVAGLHAQPPYPASKAIPGIEWDYKSHLQRGLGADQWPMAWAGDDNLYTAWGDGWGWSQQGPKYSMGVTRVTGQPPAFRGKDLWGIGPGSGVAKPEALIAFDGKLYLFWTMGRSKDDKANSGLAVSSDGGVTWEMPKERALPQAPDGFRVRGIAQFGRGYAGAPDDFVYIYAGFSRADDIYLAHVRKGDIRRPESYEWFAGLAGGEPQWSRDFDRKRPAFTDPGAYIWHIGVTYVPALGRYLLSKPHYPAGADRQRPEGDRTKIAGMGIFDAPRPWGPWTTVFRADRFFDANFKFTFFIPSKYLDADGRSFWLAWSGYPEYDNVNFIRGRLRLK